ncbi:ferritin-like domain-containing protein [Halorussus aquaticus]|uniref:Ferritin-like domain-containing protein n=1 Tax=Halorussus aquaticus TaxID=2953748 RepID=A0ABD5PZ58_9EURY|nr:ferritin-like domain-containing protein [Halorussus aquaticus]
MTNEYNDAETENRGLITELGHAFDSRRNFLKKGIVATTAGLGLSAGTGTVGASGGSDDGSGNKYVEPLNYALTLERLESTFYERGLDEFSEDELVGSDLIQRFGDPVQSTLYDQLTMIRDHEQAHVDALVSTIEDLGGQPVGEDDIEFQFDLGSPETFIETAATLETTGVSAYDGAISQFSGSDELLTAAATIATVEGRHSAYLNGLTGKSPFPEAFDEALKPAEVLEAIQPFIVSETTTQ